jgi:hypothetical protein
MAFNVSSRMDRRQAILGLLATGSTLVSPKHATALGVPAPEKTYAAFFLGQGGYWFSWGMPYLASMAQELGVETDIFEYSAVNEAWKKISQKKKDGYKIALVGYSLGNTTITYLQRYLVVDLLLAISESSLGRNHPINRINTRRSVLWYGPDFLSNAGLNDGFDKVNYVADPHLLMNVDPRVVDGVLGELRELVKWERNDGSAVAEWPVPRQTATVAQTDVITAKPEPDQTPTLNGQWPATNLPVTGDITCRRCWGLAQHVASSL